MKDVAIDWSNDREIIALVKDAVKAWQEGGKRRYLQDLDDKYGLSRGYFSRLMSDYGPSRYLTRDTRHNMGRMLHNMGYDVPDSVLRNGAKPDGTPTEPEPMANGAGPDDDVGPPDEPMGDVARRIIGALDTMADTLNDVRHRLDKLEARDAAGESEPEAPPEWGFPWELERARGERLYHRVKSDEGMWVGLRRDSTPEHVLRLVHAAPYLYSLVVHAWINDLKARTHGDVIEYILGESDDLPEWGPTFWPPKGF